MLAEQDFVRIRRKTKLRHGAVRGMLVALDEDGNAMIDFPGCGAGQPVLASSTISLRGSDVGREAVLMFEDADPARPILIGLIHAPKGQSQPDLELLIDKKKVEFTAEEEIVLRCGKASITLTRAGKVLIRGAYVLTRSSGVNRIKGGSVQIN